LVNYAREPIVYPEGKQAGTRTHRHLQEITVYKEHYVIRT